MMIGSFRRKAIYSPRIKKNCFFCSDPAFSAFFVKCNFGVRSNYIAMQQSSAVAAYGQVQIVNFRSE